MGNEGIFDHIQATMQVEKLAMVRATIARKLADLISTYPKLPVGRLLASLLRAQEEVQGQPFDWGDERTLKKIEALDKELSATYNDETGDIQGELASDEFILEMLSNKEHANS